MAIMTDLLMAIASAVSAFFGHLVAHDFVEFAPRLSRSLIHRAVAQVQREERDRYLEEWLADLNDQSGVLAKLRHAFGCLFCARHLSRQFVRQKLASDVLKVEFAGVGTIELDAATGVMVVSALQSSSWVTWLRLRKFRPAMRAATFYTKWKVRPYGVPNCDKAVRFLDLVDKNSGKKGNIKMWLNGELLERHPPKIEI